ncbi:AP2-like ethylene-responsive transcription factor ANT, partial [Cucurbita argyrosperma subsp. argyrosperma]
MTMEVTSESQQHSVYHHQSQPTPAIAISNTMSNSFSASQHYNGDFLSPLSVMPLKSDGSLCIMDSISRSQTPETLPNISPKLEDFLGGATHGREAATALSLDSRYYNQNPEANSERQQRILLHSERYYSGMFHYPAEDVNKESHIASYCSEIRQDMEQRINGCFGGGRNCQDLQTLSLSMSPGSQSSCVTTPSQISQSGQATMETKKRALADRKQPVHRKSIGTFGQRTSQYRDIDGPVDMRLICGTIVVRRKVKPGKGDKVAMIWRRKQQEPMILQLSSTQEEAAEAYDIAAIKFRGINAVTNFDTSRYDVERIMASSSLLSGEFARRNRDHKPTNTIKHEEPKQNISRTDPAEIYNNNLDWRTVFHENLLLDPSASVESIDQKSMASSGRYLNNLIGVVVETEGSSKYKAQFSNASSVVSSLSSSRETSPDKPNGSSSVPFGSNGRSIWLPSPPQMRPAPTSLPVESTVVWNDA